MDLSAVDFGRHDHLRTFNLGIARQESKKAHTLWKKDKSETPEGDLGVESWLRHSKEPVFFTKILKAKFCSNLYLHRLVAISVPIIFGGTIGVRAGYRVVMEI